MLKRIIHTELPESNAIFSNIIDRSNNDIRRLKISNSDLNKHLNSLKMDIIDNSNISGLHLNRYGKGKLATNSI